MFNYNCDVYHAYVILTFGGDFTMLKKVAVSILMVISGNAFATESYDPTKSYSTGAQVHFNDKTYEAQWWANPQDSPASVTGNSWESPWILISDADNTTPPVVPTPEPPPIVSPPEIEPSPPLDGDYSEYREGETYKAGDVVQVNGQLYRCRSGVTEPWCSGAAWAYGPGSGTAWVDAWEKISESEANKPEPEIPTPEKPDIEKPEIEQPEPEKPVLPPIVPDPTPDKPIPPPEPEPTPDNPLPPPIVPEPVPDKPEPPTVLPDPEQPSTGGGGYTITEKELEEKEAAITDFPAMIKVKEAIQTLDNEAVELIVPNGEMNPENVKRIEGIISSEDWEFLFPKRAPEYTYRNFLQATGKFPAFCGTYTDERDSDAICKKALATMFAHFTQETGGHTAYWEVPEWRQGLVHVREMAWDEEMRNGYNGECNPVVWQGQTWPCGKFENGDFKSYFGRGAKQLSYNYNYGPFSDAMFGSVRTLLDKPEMVADTWLNLASAVFFFTYPQPPKPSMLHVIDGTWQPNARDKSNGLETGFGVTTQIINGGVECGGSVEIAQSLNRIDYYKNFSEYLGLDVPEEEILGCKGMKSFDEDGAGAVDIYWEKEWGWADTPDGQAYSCSLVSYQTPYSAFKPGDFSKCVKAHFPDVNIVK